MNGRTRTLLARGDAALQAEQTFAAIEAYSGAIALRPDSMLPHLRRGETYLRRGELDAAARDLQNAAALDPTSTRPLDELGDVRYQQRLFARAADLYRRCLRLDDRSPKVSYKLALAYYRDGDIDAALAALGETLRLDDRMVDAYYLQGLSLQQRQRLPQARRALEKAVALRPGFVAAHEELADLYGLLGRRADELEQLQVLANMDRAHAERHVALGMAHARWAVDPQESETIRASHADLAVITLRSALMRMPDEPVIQAALGRVWLQLAETREDPVALDKALQVLEQAGSSSAAASDVLTLYGRALLRIGRAEAAETVLQHATERYPIDPQAFLWYADAAEQQKHADAARQALIHYIDLTADERDFTSRAVRIAQLSTRVNDFETATAWLQRALVERPNDPRLLALLAETQLKNGNHALH